MSFTPEQYILYSIHNTDRIKVLGALSQLNTNPPIQWHVSEIGRALSASIAEDTTRRVIKDTREIGMVRDIRVEKFRRVICECVDMPVWDKANEVAQEIGIIVPNLVLDPEDTSRRTSDDQDFLARWSVSPLKRGQA